MEATISSTSEDGSVRHHLRFFALPPELRIKILNYVLHIDKTLDTDFNALRRVAIFSVSKRFHDEATAVFYGSNTFRLFPINARGTGNRSKALISRFSPRHRAELTSLELRLGPHWIRPPASWKVDNELGLEDAISVRVLQVFVEVDPTHEVFNGFRTAKDFYTGFAGDLLRQIIKRLPNLQHLQFDGYPSVSRGGPLMTRLVKEAVAATKKISWGPGQIFDNVTNANIQVCLAQVIKSKER
ncbi:hypothetical protein MMC19_005596 [Ptychographa xylographoides]|nr:hypothetical protein [Ptychographa xylographoides]